MGKVLSGALLEEAGQKIKDSYVAEIANSRGQVIRVGGQRVVVVSDPYTAHSREQIFAMAESIAVSGGSMLFGSMDKDPVDEERLSFLKDAGERYGLPVVCEIHCASQVSNIKKYVDIFLTDPEKMDDFSFLKTVAATGRAVILGRKNKSGIDSYLKSAEYLSSCGCSNVILCEPGTMPDDGSVKKVLDFSSIPELKACTSFPVLVDLRTVAKDGSMVQPLSLASIVAGADGVIVSVSSKKSEPDTAALELNQFDKLMHDLQAMVPVIGKSLVHIRKAKKEKIVCAFSGKKGAYAEQAVGRYFDSMDVTALAVDSFSEIFQSVVDGKADYGMVPIENSLAGSVYQNYDNFCHFQEVTIVGAVTLNIRHALLGPKGATIDGIKTVYSHPQGFGQCKRFLDNYKSWTHIDSVSTATAAKFVADRKDKALAAIASTVNADLYELDILQEDIEDDPNNFTRFLVIQSVAQKRPSVTNLKSNMASFIFKTKNEPGALYKTLGIFERYKVNLTRLESRPIEGKAWNYWFYADAELSNILAEIDEDLEQYVKRLSKDLESITEDIRLLGVYPEIRP